MTGDKKHFTHGVLAMALLSAFALNSCTQRPTQAQLETWHREAIAVDRAILAQQTARDQQQQWGLTIEGKTTIGQPVRLNWSELEELATTTLKTRSPHHASDPNAVLKFRGIRVSDLLNQYSTLPEVNTITFVAFDGYRATVSLADLRRYPIAIALEMEGKPLSRSDGGPLFLVFPYTSSPELERKYPDQYWVFYVTHIIAGTENINLKVGNRNLTVNDLNSLETVTLEEPVGYRTGWPSTPVKLHGYRLRDVLQAAGVILPETGEVLVRGKAPIYWEGNNPVRLAVSDVRECDILLANGWSDTGEPIPARLGGPVTLALPSRCQSNESTSKLLPDDRRWVTFVEEIELSEQPPN